MNILPSPILVTGAARSGTSLAAGSINMCGAFGGEMAGPNRNNAKGMFENFRIRNDILKPYLRNIKADPLGQYPLPDIESMPIPVNLRETIERVMREQGYQAGPWMYKGAKMCLTWKMWHHAFPDAKWVIVRRSAEDIADSCIKTHFMRAFGNESTRKAVGAETEKAGWLWWVDQHLTRFREMQDAGLNVKIVWPERMINGDYSQLMKTIDWLGLKWNTNILTFVDKKLWKARKNG